MSLTDPLKRAYLIVKFIREKHYPNRKDLVNLLKEHDIQVSEKTVERDIDYLKYNLLIYPEYLAKERGYHFSKNDLNNSTGVLRFLEIAYLAENIGTSDYSKYISYGETELLKGVEKVPQLLDAIDQKQVITFQHENYLKGTKKKVRLAPHLMREYLNRWYIIGYKQDTKELRTFGVDRISDLIITEEKFQKNERQNLHSLFDHVIGVVYNHDQIIELEFKVPYEHKKYFDSLPLHQSQIHLIDTDGESYYQIEVVANYELEQKLLMHSPLLTVTKPAHYVKYFGDQINEIAQRYA